MFNCPIPNAAYCDGDSLNTHFIIRCRGVIGHVENCDQSLYRKFPEGISLSPCFQTSAYSGDAACTKNCVIYGSSGNYNGSSSVLSDCVPGATPTSSPAISSTLVTTITYSNTSTSTAPPTHLISPTAYYPPTLITLITAPSASPTPLSNGTTILTNSTSASSATNVPVGPTTTMNVGPVVFKGAATANQACAALAIVGMIFVAFL